MLDKKLKGTSFDDDMTCAFCRIWPNLHPVSGGVQRVNRAHPVWGVLLRVHGVNTIPRFLRHLFTKHDGEARLIGGTSWTPMMTTHVCNPKFWSYQFARTGETRKWQYRKKKQIISLLMGFALARSTGFWTTRERVRHC